MNRRILSTGMAVVTLFFLCQGTGASAGMSLEGFKGAITAPSQGQVPIAKPFKLKGGGQIDVNTFTLYFAGAATHLGRYTASGQVDPATSNIRGTMTAANGDTLDWVAQFSTGPLGEIDAGFTVTGGTGRFEGATGEFAGPVVLDPDLMFTLNLLGTIAY